MTTKQDRAVLALLTCRTIADAAKVAGVSERTLRRWLKQPEFQQALARERAQVFAAVTGRLTRYATAAVDFLYKVMRSKNTTPADSVRVRAARVLLTSAIAVRCGEVFDRLDEVEEGYRSMDVERKVKL